MRRGFTLVEVLLGLFFVPLILSLSVSILTLMQGTYQRGLSQVDVFLLQQRQFLMHANHVRFVGETLEGTYLNEPFVILFDRFRLVKRPGYEILLEGVHFVYREDGCLFLSLDGGEICVSLP